MFKHVRINTHFFINKFQVCFGPPSREPQRGKNLSRIQRSRQMAVWEGLDPPLLTPKIAERAESGRPRGARNGKGMGSPLEPPAVLLRLWFQPSDNCVDFGPCYRTETQRTWLVLLKPPYLWWQKSPEFFTVSFSENKQYFLLFVTVKSNAQMVLVHAFVGKEKFSLTLLGSLAGSEN